MERGYGIFITLDEDGFYIPEAWHIEKIDKLNMFKSDEEASKQAEEDGVNLIYGMKGVPDGVYIDTKENRKIIKDMLEKFPEYRIDI